MEGKGGDADSTQRRECVMDEFIHSVGGGSGCTFYDSITSNRVLPKQWVVTHLWVADQFIFMDHGSRV